MRVALTVFFAMHIVAASLAMGLPLLIAAFARRREALARGMVTVALVSLSAAVVMGVAALLFICRAWPKPFVSAVVALFGPFLAVVPLLALAFASMYAYQIRGWRPGPVVGGIAILGVAMVFAAIAARQEPTGAWLVRLAHFVPAAFAAGGVAIMVRFADPEEARIGARIAFFASLVQSATGVVYLLSLARVPGGVLLYAPIAGAAGLLVVLGLLSFGPRITRFASLAAAGGLFFVVLSMAALREGVRV